MPAPCNHAPLTETRLGHWRLLADFGRRLQRATEGHAQPGTFSDQRRHLQLGDYLGLFLFGLLNPAVRTMRALCEASHLERVQTEICRRPVSLGSFSEAQAVVDPALLERVFGELAGEVATASAQGGGAPARAARWIIQDSTLWEVLPRMHWARWRTQGRTQRAVRLHLGLHLWEDKPLRARVSEGAFCERRAWRENWQPGDAYIGDRNFSQDYRALGELDALGCTFIVRLCEQAVITVEEEIPLTEEDRQKGVLRQAFGYLGCKARYRSLRVRLLWVQGPREVLILVTNQSPAQLSAAAVAALYKQRWQVELFFRWIKCILGCRHWLAESAEGVAIQIYLALIGALLLQLYSGQRPTKRMMELIQLHLLGVATDAELEAGLARLWAARQKARRRAAQKS